LHDTWTDVNEAAIKATGRIRPELIGTDFSDYFAEPEKAKAASKITVIANKRMKEFNDCLFKKNAVFQR
jgi:hypothetical protein